MTYIQIQNLEKFKCKKICRNFKINKLGGKACVKISEHEEGAVINVQCVLNSFLCDV